MKNSLLVLLAILISTVSLAQPPNDDCAGAILLEPLPLTNLNTTFALAEATVENEPGCDGGANADYVDLWYQVTMPIEGNLRINANNRNRFQLFDACNGTQIDCFTGSKTIQNISAGTTYTLRLYRPSPTDGFFLNFSLFVYPSAENDDCDGAIELDPVAGSTLITNFEFLGADIESEPGCDGDTPADWYDIWYDVTMPEVGNLRLNSNNRNRFQLFDACGGTEIDCFQGSKTIENLPVGDYKLRLYRNVTDRYNLSFDLRVYPSAENDDCDGAIELDPVAGSTLITNFEFLGADIENEPGCDGDTPADWYDIWYDVTMPEEGNLWVWANNRNRFQLFDACGGTEIECFQGSKLIENLNTGNYKLRLFRNVDDRYSLSFNLRVYPQATNDDCNTAATLPVSTTQQTQSFEIGGADFENELNCSGTQADYSDIWYTFTMPVSGNLQITSNNRNSFQLFTGCETGEIDCFNASKLVEDLVGGQEYKLRVFRTVAGASDRFSLNFTHQAFAVIPNDDCANAQIITGLETEQTIIGEINGADINSEFGCTDTPANYADVWYEFTMPVDGFIHITSNNVNQFGLYDSCGGTRIDCFTGTGDFTDLTAGTTYYLRYFRAEADAPSTFNRNFDIYASCNTNEWTGGGDGTSWEDTANWSLGHVPIACENVLINPTNPTSIVIDSDAVAAAVRIERADTDLTINDTWSLTIDGSLNGVDDIGLWINKDNCDLINEGTITVRNMAYQGILFLGDSSSPMRLVNNGVINIDNVSLGGIANSLALSGTTNYMNAGQINISDGQSGLYVSPDATFTNNDQFSLTGLTGKALNVTGNFVNESGATVTVDQSNENSIGGSGVFTNNGTYTSTNTTGSSTSIISIVSSKINGSGVFSLDKKLQNRSELSPGNSPGVLTINGDYVSTSTGVFKAEIAGTDGAGQPTGHDQLVVDGDVTLDGALTLDLTGYTPNNSDLFTIMTYTGTLTGEFATVTGLPDGWVVNYGNYNEGEIVIGPATILPVKLTSFTVSKLGSSAQLNWTTASEQNNEGFVIEHSKDGINWQEIGWVNGAGNSAQELRYSHLHTQPTQGANYYRLQQVDFDGSKEYSDVKQLTFIGKNTVVVYPNPAINIIKVDADFVGNATVRIINATGQVLNVIEQYEAGQEIDIHKLPRGFYLIELITQEKTIAQQFIKQ